MVKSIFKLLLLLIIGIMIYNYFMGTPEEKQNVERIVSEFKDFAGSVVDLVKSEKEKFDKGKYDQALDKIGDTLDKVKESVKQNDAYRKDVEKLLSQKENLRRELSEIDDSQEPSIDTSKIKKELEELIQQTEQLLKRLSEPQR